MALLADLYELTMAASYHEHRPRDRATFDLFVRRLPPERSFLIFAGLESAVFYLTHLAFGPEAIRYLRGTGLFPPRFLAYLGRLRFRGDVDAMPEGTVFFPNEPVLRVTGTLIEAQIVETFLLNAVNFQTLVASKAARVVAAAGGRPVVEFGQRRAQGADAAVKAARSAWIAGCAGTSSVLAGQLYGLPVYGTMAHSFVQAYASELEAFRAFAESYPDGTTLLIDTYDTVEGARRAGLVARELARRGKRLGGVRLDSGDLVDLSRRVRRVLDAQGLRRVEIFASGNLTEARIAEVLRRGAPIDAFGVGTDLVVSGDAPSLDTVYKLSEVERGGRWWPALKLSPGKQTYPGRKQVRRRERDGRFAGDLLALEGEAAPGRALLTPVLRGGKLVAPLPTLAEVRRRAARQVAALPPRLTRLEESAAYPVRVSRGLRRAVEACRRERSTGETE
jgi:nicotinate phosphoribosyltransferase